MKKDVNLVCEGELGPSGSHLAWHFEFWSVKELQG
jgi:hypothetical protein